MNNETKQPEEKIGLLRKAYARLRSSKLVKKVAALGIAAVIAFNFYGCDNTPTPDDDVVIDGGTIEDDQGNEIECSELLMDILEDEYYNNLIQRAKDESSLYETGYFDPHPYAFLENQGYNIEDIKNGKMEAYTISYILDEEPNNLYIHTRIFGGYYYDMWHLKYTLTDQEVKDYNLLHNSGSDHYYGTTYYIQSVFMNNEISKQKIPTIVGSSRISVEVFEGLTDPYENAPIVDSEVCDSIVYLSDPNEGIMKIICMPRYYEQGTYKKHFLREMTYQSYTDYNNNILVAPTVRSHLNGIVGINKNATFYSTQYALLKAAVCETLTK